MLHCTGQMVDDWHLTLDSKNVTGPLQLTYPKLLVPYICDNFVMILAKLHAYGVSEKVIDFLHSYLSGRKQVEGEG